MTKEEEQELREECLDTPHEQLVETFIRLKKCYQGVCREFDKLEEELEKCRDSEEILDELIAGLQEDY